jgi:hypothetical protein
VHSPDENELSSKIGIMNVYLYASKMQSKEKEWQQAHTPFETICVFQLLQK